MIDTYIYWSGVFFNLTFAVAILLVIWFWLIFPAVEAFSMTRYYLKLGKVHGIKMHHWFRIFCNNYEFFGRSFTSQRCDYGVWSGVGKWEIFPPNTEEMKKDCPEDLL